MSGLGAGYLLLWDQCPHSRDITLLCSQILWLRSSDRNQWERPLPAEVSPSTHLASGLGWPKGWGQQGVSTAASAYGLSVWLLMAGQLCPQRECPENKHSKRTSWKAFMIQPQRWHSSVSATFYWWKHSKPTQLKVKTQRPHLFLEEMSQNWGPYFKTATGGHW